MSHVTTILLPGPSSKPIPMEYSATGTMLVAAVLPGAARTINGRRESRNRRARGVARTCPANGLAADYSLGSSPARAQSASPRASFKAGAWRHLQARWPAQFVSLRPTAPRTSPRVSIIVHGDHATTTEAPRRMRVYSIPFAVNV